MADDYEILGQGNSVAQALEFTQQMDLQNKYRKDALSEKKREFDLRNQERQDGLKTKNEQYLSGLHDRDKVNTGNAVFDQVANNKLKEFYDDANNQLENGGDFNNILGTLKSNTQQTITGANAAKSAYNQIQQAAADKGKVIPIDQEKLNNAVTNSIISKVIDPTTKNFNPNADYQGIANQWSGQFNNPDFMGNYVKSTEPLLDLIKKGGQKGQINVGNPKEYNTWTYTQYPHQTTNFDIKKQNGLGFVPGFNGAPQLKTKGIAIDPGHGLTNNGQPFYIADPNDYHDLVSKSSPYFMNTMLAAHAIGETNGAYNNLSDAEKEIARQHSLYNNFNQVSSIPISGKVEKFPDQRTTVNINNQPGAATTGTLEDLFGEARDNNPHGVHNSNTGKDENWGLLPSNSAFKTKIYDPNSQSYKEEPFDDLYVTPDNKVMGVVYKKNDKGDNIGKPIPGAFEKQVEIPIKAYAATQMKSITTTKNRSNSIDQAVKKVQKSNSSKSAKPAPNNSNQPGQFNKPNGLD